MFQVFNEFIFKSIRKYSVTRRLFCSCGQYGNPCDNIHFNALMLSIQAKLSFIERKPCASPKIWKTKWKKHKIQIFFLNRSRISASSSLESSMKRFLRRFESNQNKTKQIKINDVFGCFISKAYSAAILSRIFH